MVANLNAPFDPSCCEGGACNLDDNSAAPCGCDKGAGWVCAQHREDAMRDTVPAYDIIDCSESGGGVGVKWNPIGIPEYENFATCPPKDGYAGISRDFVIKDSGKREQYSGGMVRDTTEGKVMYSLIADGPMLKRWAVHLTKGAAKYGVGNWLKAEGDVELRRAKDSAFRHFMQWYYGEVDEDHASAVFFNINEAEYVKDKMRK